MQYLCKKCNRNLDADQFYTRNSKLVFPCKSCKRDYYKQWKTQNQAYHDEWHKRNPGKTKVYNDKYRKRRKTEREETIREDLKRED